MRERISVALYCITGRVGAKEALEKCGRREAACNARAQRTSVRTMEPESIAMRATRTKGSCETRITQHFQRCHVAT